MPFRFLSNEKHHRHTSLFGEMLDWLLAPLLILWPVSMAVEYSLAYSIANTAYDRALRDRVIALSRHVANEAGDPVLKIFAAAEDILRSDQVDEIYFQVRGRDNEWLAGDRDLAPVEFSADLEPGVVYFRNDVHGQREIRAAYMFAQVSGLAGAVLVQVGETDGKRTRLASDIIGGVLAAQFLLLPLGLLLVWFGLSKGIRPLNELADRVRARAPSDLSPVALAETPEEMRPFVNSINDLVARLEQSVRAQQRFVADAAHQMRTPLAGLKTQAELALRSRDAAGVEHAVRQIAVGADRASHLVNQLLALARAEGEAPIAQGRLDLEVLVRDTAREWVARAMDKQIDLGFESSGTPCWIDGNPILLREMVGNLIDNALKYTPTGGRVTVRLVRGEQITFEVEDNGIGIDAADREFVFERFFRVLGTGTEGTGLGLAIVRSIAQMHGARPAMRSPAEGRGTVAVVSFPHSTARPRSLRNAA